jgi:hypothetical protein
LLLFQKTDGHQSSARASVVVKMKAAMATSPGRVGKPNEDFVGAVPSAVVLLDGAGIPGTEASCRHGVAWYTHRLGAHVLGRLSRDTGLDLVIALAESIEQVAGEHRDSCDITNPSSPQSTVAMVRFDEDRVDFLVLADSFVVLDQPETEPRVVADPREVAVRRECSAVLHGLREGTPEYDLARLSAVEALRARRNQPDGYWIAKEDPNAATHAVTGSTSLASIVGAALLSNGASRIVDPYGLATWSAVLELMRTSGPAEIIQQVRAAEDAALAADSQPDVGPPDDATAAYCEAP